MDSLRDRYGSDHAFTGADSMPAARDANFAADELHDGPPPMIGRDERRMQVRAYNYWASLLADRNFPAIDDLTPGKTGDFGPFSVLLDFSLDEANPRIAFLGDRLAEECDIGNTNIRQLSDVPSRSLLSRITDHYLQIIANQAPIGFEAEFVNQRGSTILYRGILLPFSSDDSQIDYIYGVINWKELADQQATDELLLEIDQALEAAPMPRRADPAPIADWADGPGMLAGFDIPDAEYAEVDSRAAAHHLDDVLDLAAEALALDDPAAMSLADWLAAAREQAEAARESDHRSRGSLYDAIGRAWDFTLAALDAPQDFAELLADSGLTIQERAPMTPVVKLVFGSDYDKTRLTEYAAALTHARRIGLGRGELTGFLRQTEGGLKAVVATERRCRREEAGATQRVRRDQPRAAICQLLRALPAQPLSALPAKGQEFALVLVRRTAQDTVELLGELPGDAGLLEKAARQLAA